ncbi:Ig-like domain-containing protein [Pusillimonas sp. ANT_WB101]|uniref:Ig-like domain-containing protein n=1 Tax=Pusillimonas sp. ANT_WB101 TaxID=2597356 RepID=UPI0011EF6710|nr:Ig-like domain-containing protein [Pusillimonas sp. ANT_WB101]KAA0910684.1 Ig domain-containing protein [Pusillimonas sp. ANT_WB101]
MANCIPANYVGKDVVLEYFIDCGNDTPQEGDWNLLGSMRTKGFDGGWDTDDATDDATKGYLSESVATGQTFSVSGDGTCKRGPESAALSELTKHFFNPIATGGQPLVWMRLTYPDLTFTVLTLLTSLGRTGESRGGVTFSLEASGTASTQGVIVEDTPAEVPVTSVTMSASTLAISTSEILALTATVAPGGAPQGAVWKSSAPSKATVDQNGHVVGVATGTANITATSTSDPLMSDTCVVTVSA